MREESCALKLKVQHGAITQYVVFLNYFTSTMKDFMEFHYTMLFVRD